MRQPERSPELEAIRPLYKTARWQAVRKAQLTAEPLCRHCKVQGITTPATVCDHVIPHRGDVAKFWSGPYQSLCAPHHDAGKQREDAAGYHAEPDEFGWPTDGRHPANRKR